MAEEQIVKQFRPDKLEFGTPSKGFWQCYFDASDKEESKRIIDNIVELFIYASDKDATAREQRQS